MNLDRTDAPRPAALAQAKLPSRAWRLPGAGLALALSALFAVGGVFPQHGDAAVRHHAARSHKAAHHGARHAKVPQQQSAQSAGAADGCANATVPATSASADAMRNAVVCLVNNERATYHLPPLVQVPRLVSSAQSFTTEMVQSNFFSHTAPNGSTPGTRISATGYQWAWAGENIASGYATPLAVVTAWMQSPEHCYNILAPVFMNIGVGVTPQGVGSDTTPATWTEDFGTPLGGLIPSGSWAPAKSCGH